MMNRRSLLLGGVGVLSAASLGLRAHAAEKAKIVIVGGGFGGATAASVLAGLMPQADIALISADERYVACPFSNLVIAGERDMTAQEFMAGRGPANVKRITARAETVDTGERQVTLAGGETLTYDRLILSPGISLPRGDPRMPHAWQGGDQTMLLRRQLEAMEDGGTVVMSVPATPYRCPPGPYERASLIAHYLKTRKPRSKLIVLDAKDKFSKMALFQEAWAEHYPDHLEWRGASDDGRVVRTDPEAMTVHTDFEDIKADVANIIPAQKAGDIAQQAGVADASGWCPIDGLSFQSSLQENVYVIGDASIANPMPKSAFSANMQAKICAIAVARSLLDLEPEPTVLANTCYSFVTPGEAVSISAVYRNEGGELSSVEGAGGLTPTGAAPVVRKAEAAQARDWFRAISAEAFG